MKSPEKKKKKIKVNKEKKNIKKNKLNKQLDI